MNILAIDTTSSYGSVAISSNDKIIYINYMNVRITHSERLMEQIDLGLKNSKLKIEDLDLILIVNGPGSFTGVRIGLATMKGIAFGLKIPLVPINSLKAMASPYRNLKKRIAIIKDAKMNEIYAAVYDENLDAEIEPQCFKPEEFFGKIQGDCLVVGDCIEKFKDTLISKKLDFLESDQNIFLASSLFSFKKEINDSKYDFSAVSKLEPYYLRKSEAERKKDLSS